MANGHYCFLLAMTTCWLQGDVAEISKTVKANDFPEVVVTNYHELSTARDFRRVPTNGLIGTGIGAAIRIS